MSYASDIINYHETRVHIVHIINYHETRVHGTKT